MKRIIVFVNGILDSEDSFYKETIKEDDIILCADGGARHAYNLGLLPMLVLGDMDSIPAHVYDYFYEKGVSFEFYSRDKDKTDTEILLDKIVEHGFKNVVIFGAIGGRLDHTIGNIHLLEKYQNSGTAVSFLSPEERLFIVSKMELINNEAGKTVSILPLTDVVKGVTLKGFKYQLIDGIIERGSTLGMSNIIIEERAEITVKQGKAIVILNNKKI